MTGSLEEKIPDSRGSMGDEVLQTYLKRNGMIPTEEQVRDCYSGLSILNQTLLGGHFITVADAPPLTFVSTVQGVTLISAPVGAYLLGCWDVSATISCTIAGTPSEETFFDLALHRLRKNHDIVLMDIDKTGPTMFRTSIKGFVFSIQYHQSPYTRCWNQMSRRGLEENISLAPGAKRRFNAYRDTLYMRSIIQDRRAFTLAYLAIKLWARRHGIFSKVFGYLDETTLLPMIVQASCHPEANLTAGATQIVSNFFNYYGSMELAEFINGGIVPQKEGSSVRSQLGHGIVIYSYHSPSYNLSNVKTTAYAQIIQSEIANCKTLMRGEWEWETLLGEAQKNAIPGSVRTTSFILTANPLLSAHAYANTYDAFIKIEAAHWGASNIEQGRYFQSIETIGAEFARKVSLKQADGLFARPWPIRLRRQKDQESDPPRLYHSVCYLIGLRISPAFNSSPPNARSWRTDFEALKATLREYITDLETSTSSINLDSDSSFFAVSLLQEDQLGEDYIEDDKSWGPIPIDEAELDDLDDDDSELEERQSTKPKTNRATKPRGNGFGDVNVREDIARSPLRPALDVLNRLRFDSKFAVDDYVIGYEDRHAGIMEMPVTSWKTSDNTMEDFIPQSRIVYYKRKVDGVEVWNRRKRLDIIFGSGTRQRE